MGISAVAAGASIAASAASTAGAIDSMTSGGGSTSAMGGGNSVPTGYQPQGQPQADQYYQNLLAQMSGYAGQLPQDIMPNSQRAYSNIVNSPQYAQQYQDASRAAGAYAGGVLAPMEQAGAASLQGLGGLAAQYAPQILSTGFDPQHALYDRTQQQITDQLNAQNARSGLSGTPYGAGVAGQGITNFNIDWQNQQLQRQLAATQGYSNLSNTAGRDYAGAGELGGLAVGSTLASGQLPYSTFLGTNNDITNAGNAYAGAGTTALGLDQNTLNALSAYLKLGQSATGIGQAGQNQAFNQGQTLGANVGAGIQGLSSGISGLAGLFGGGSGGVDPTNPISYGGGGSYGSNADMFGAFPGFDFSAAG